MEDENAKNDAHSLTHSLSDYSEILWSPLLLLLLLPRQVAFFYS
jgi:hypothetical protein